MPELQIFKQHDKQLRVIPDSKGTPLWCLSDICKMLEIKNSKDVKRRLDPRWAVSIDLPHPQSKTGKTIKRNFIGERNLNRLIFQSRKKEAIAIQNWIYDEVMPSLNKTGTFTMDLVELLEEENKELTKQLKKHEEAFVYELDFQTERLNDRVKDLEFDVIDLKAKIKELQRIVILQEFDLLKVVYDMME